MTTVGFRSRVDAFLDSFQDEKDYSNHLTGFWSNWSREMPYHHSIPRDDITLLFIGDSKRKGLFQHAGDHTLLTGNLKSWARPALMTLFQILLNDREPLLFTQRFRQMPISDLQKINLNKHLEHGDPEQQMAAFRLCRLLFHSYPQTEFLSILNGRTAAFDIFQRLHQQWLVQHPDGASPVTSVSTPVQQSAQTVQQTTQAATTGPTIPGLTAENIRIPIIEQATQPIIQPVVHQMREVIIQPIIIQPEVHDVVRETLVQAPLMQKPVVKESVAAPIFIMGTNLSVQEIINQIQVQLNTHLTITNPPATSYTTVEQTTVPAVRETTVTETITPLATKEESITRTEEIRQTAPYGA